MSPSPALVPYVPSPVTPLMGASPAAMSPAPMLATPEQAGNGVAVNGRASAEDLEVRGIGRVACGTQAKLNPRVESRTAVQVDLHIEMQTLRDSRFEMQKNGRVDLKAAGLRR